MTRILYANDIHFNGNSAPHYPKSHIAFPLFMRYLRTHVDRFDHLIIGGDCVNRGPARIDDLTSFRDELDAIGLSYHVVAGNHDLAPSREYARMYPGMEDWEEGPLIDTNFGKVFGDRGLRSCFPADRVNCILFSLRNEDFEAQLEWVADEISRSDRVLLFCHYPLVPSRSGGFCNGWGYKRIDSVREKLIGIVRAAAGKVLIYFCGHQHINSRTSIGRTEQVVTGALGASPFCFRIVEISASVIKIKTRRLTGIPGRFDEAMNPESSTDSEHRTLQAYHWGRRRERDFSVRIQGGSPPHPIIAAVIVG